MINIAFVHFKKILILALRGTILLIMGIFINTPAMSKLYLDAMLEYANYDKAMIVSGDGDFHCLIEHLHRENKLLKIVIPNRHDFSSLLRKFAPQMLFMNGLKNKLEYKKR